MKEFLIQNADNLVILIMGFGAWWFERYKRKESEVAMTKDIVSMYRDALADFELKTSAKIKEFEEKIYRLEKELDSWKGKYQSLKKEFDRYKKAHQ